MTWLNTEWLRLADTVSGECYLATAPAIKQPDVFAPVCLVFKDGGRLFYAGDDMRKKSLPQLPEGRWPDDNASDAFKVPDGKYTLFRHIPRPVYQDLSQWPPGSILQSMKKTQ